MEEADGRSSGALAAARVSGKHLLTSSARASGTSRLCQAARAIGIAAGTRERLSGCASAAKETEEVVIIIVRRHMGT